MAKIYDAEMQYLNVAVAKHVGLDANGCVVAFQSDRISREYAGLKPLLVYSIVAPCYSVMARMLVDASAPISISRFLSQAWSTAHGVGLPQRLELDEAILASDRGFTDWAQSQGVICEPALSAKSLRAFARSAQDLGWAITFVKPDRNSQASPTLDAANGSLHYFDNFTIEVSQGTRKSMDQMTFEAWIGRGQPFFNGSHMDDDWSSTCLVEPPSALPKPHLAAQPGDGDEPLFVPGLKELVAMWPGGRRAFLRGLQTTARDFDHWIAGRAHLPPQASAKVLKRAGATYDPQIDGLTLGGGNLLIAQTAIGVERVYIELSNGGDLEYAFEVVSPPGRELPVRVLVFAAWGGPTNLILFPRDGGRAEAQLDDLSLINLTPARNAPGDVWDTLSWIFENREMFDKPQVVAMEFGVRHMDWLAG